MLCSYFFIDTRTKLVSAIQFSSVFKTIRLPLTYFGFGCSPLKSCTRERNETEISSDQAQGSKLKDCLDEGIMRIHFDVL